VNDATGGACSMQGRDENVYRFLVGNLKGNCPDDEGSKHF
jgi:hypothetical protein